MAGIVYDGQKKWIRPVGSGQHGEVSQDERQYEDGSEPRVLDVVSVPLLRPQPHSFQRENWLLDPDSRWEKVGRVGWGELLELEQFPRTLWTNGYDTYHGSNDRVPVEQADTAADSLNLIRVDRVTLLVADEGYEYPKRVVRAQFRYEGHDYALRVTDPQYEQVYLTRPFGVYGLGESFMTVSLGETYYDFAYKLVAAIIERAKVEAGDTS
ncbi:hypothetical protein NE234_23220 [Actinoallomurus sp. WRP9H-5]|nr:hypothetical protein [Actinoallomurus rhizosphaericola]MCO5996281.1 hypothetical protein [Actinoallomurus rhizosphaericola]